ncbi:volume-regulated anion channel subunit LRRC8D [Grus japonensis]|uniref:Volume-regulated anion channel subunit LRRC8D n=1 Tax=Grus japonensis TaxID=30415 RepID=A0ABC9X601_GRUJA
MAKRQLLQRMASGGAVFFQSCKNRFLSPFRKWVGREAQRPSCSSCQGVQGDILGRRKPVFLESSQQNATFAQHSKAGSSTGREYGCTKDLFVATVLKEIPSLSFLFRDPFLGEGRVCGTCQNEKVTVSAWLGIPVTGASWSQRSAQLKPEEEGGEAQPDQECLPLQKLHRSMTSSQLTVS